MKMMYTIKKFVNFSQVSVPYKINIDLIVQCFAIHLKFSNLEMHSFNWIWIQKI